jgi:hypothetical protein
MLKEIKAQPVINRISEYETNWLKHIDRMQRNNLPILESAEMFNETT